MDSLFSVDWNALFVPDASILEILICGSILYVVIFFILRFIPSRQIGGVGMNDMLLVVLIATAASNSMNGDHKSITSGLLLVVTVIFWSYAFNWLSMRVPFLQRVFQPKPILLIKDGEIQLENLHKELITEEELLGDVRRQGLKGFKEVREAYVESNGQISIVPAES